MSISRRSLFKFGAALLATAAIAPIAAALEPKSQPVIVTPEMFGAVGDGVTDDSAALRAAVEFVKKSGGGTIKFAARTYVTDALPLPINVYLRGF